jgi:hypothetical protein
MLEFLKPQRKDKYQPSTAKRFEVSEDPFSRKRMQALRDIHHELEADFKHSIHFSFSVFGSLVKGKVLTPETSERADIDLWVDLDEEEIPYEFRTEHFIENIRLQVIMKIQEKAEELGLSKKEQKHVGVRVLNDDFIHKYAEKAYYRNTPMLGRKYSNITLASLFTLSIGEPVKKYRNRFLVDLVNKANKQEAEAIWQAVRKVVEDIERKGQGVPEQLQKHFPKTLEEAVKFYGVKL